MDESVRILIVEDAPSDAELIQLELRRGGLAFVAEVVDASATYLAALHTRSPHIVLSDLSLPGFDGLSALRLLMERSPEVPFIAVTGSRDEAVAADLIQAGATDYVVKDDLGRLVPAVRAALERRLLVEVGRHAERGKLEAQEWAQATIDALSSHICVLNASGTIVAVNRAWRGFAAVQGGGSARTMEGASYLEACARATGEAGTEARAFGEGLRELLAGEREAVDLEYRCPTPERDAWFAARATPFLTQGERHAVVAHEDVTARKEQEAALLQAEQQLMLAQKMEAIGRLAGGVAHDFNNMLSVIRGQAERALRTVEVDDPTRTRLRQILSSADRASRLTRQLLAFSRQQILEPRVVRLDAIVGEAQEMLERIIGEDIALTVASPARLGHVRVDPGQFVQVLLNLAVNARDAMPQGGALTVEFADVTLDEAYARRHPACVPGTYVQMAVTDAGCGMDETTQSRVFEPFFTSKPEGMGTGLGLATVYGTVKQSGGFIWVYSEVGHGTSFKIYLPRVYEPVGEARAVAAPPPRSSSVRPDARILVVEDDANVRAILGEVLSAEGYAVTTSATPAEALDLLATEHRPDVLVTDVIMPGMNGQQLASRALALRPGLRVLYVSGYAGEAVIRQGGLSPRDNYLQKPFSETDLLNSVAEILRLPAVHPARSKP